MCDDGLPNSAHALGLRAGAYASYQSRDRKAIAQSVGVARPRAHAWRQNELSPVRGKAMLPSPLSRNSMCGEAMVEALEQFRPRHSKPLALHPRHGNSTDVCKVFSRIACATWPSPVTARRPTSSEADIDQTTGIRTSTHSTNSTSPRFSARSW